MQSTRIFLVRSVLMRLVLTQTYRKKLIVCRDNSKKNQFPLIGIAALGFLWSRSEEKTEKKENVNTVLEKSDEEFENGRYEDCYQTLMLSKFHDNVEVRWRICRALYNLSRDLKFDENYRKGLIKQAYEIIEKEVTISPNHYAVHKWFALILEAKTSYEGYKERIKNLENIKQHMDLAVILNPNDATTFHMLGEWCFQITEMPWHHRRTAEVLFASLPTSNYEDALEYFLKAETVQPRFYSMNLLRIGICYLKLNRPDQAKYYLQLAAIYPAKSNEDHQANKEATELLKKIK
ncbi:regulator of microtubule dynamics protein 1 [Papilio machaon]|uniref:regulator of microtubule dynamics protein 1 n=1 Tax=Papilio machaon TaxID=76193 RepID=UPI001E66553B|nr:regulator of microtubule dynamics protein 1 [Papilio machaon]